MRIVKAVTLITSGMLLVSCGQGYRDEPAPVLSDGSSGVVVQAYQAPQRMDIRPTYSAPVGSLLKESHKLQSEGDIAGAVASIERALRIEPRNAYLWNRLAHLRLDQGQGKRAAELAAKSTSLAGADAKLKIENWRMIAKVKRSSGDSNGAMRAEYKATELEYR
jgi:predicted Zn-dependent protease